ncbi:MAG: IS3 family transposase, partial [Planctomycetota bacterium]|nr:IS3 family transposase [Planctomycetota bacterium]
RVMRKTLIHRGHPQLSVRRQAELLQVNRNRPTPRPRELPGDESVLRLEIDKLHLAHPYYGSRRVSKHLQAKGRVPSRGRARRLMRCMNLTAIYPKPRTSLRAPEHRVYPYLLRDLKITRPNQVWCSDITYIPMRRGFAYLVAIMDWHSRAVLGWSISNTLGADSCLEALEAARKSAGCWPEIMNTDQGCQYTSEAWTSRLKDADVKISMDGKRCWIDNVLIERLWRSLKYEDIYLREYTDLVSLEAGVGRWMSFYNHERLHQALAYKTPWQVWKANRPAVAA